jgi:melibiose permease
MTMTVLPIIGLLAALVIFKKKYILTEEKVAEIAAELKRQSN